MLVEAEQLFASYKGPGTEANRIGEKVLEVFSRCRTPEDLSVDEMHCLIKAYNWSSRHREGFDLAKDAVLRLGLEFMRDLDIAMHNAFYWPKGAYAHVADQLIIEGVGPATHWFLRKADWWVSEAIGEHESDHERYPGDPIKDQSALDLAATQLDLAIRAATPDEKLPDPSWKERFAPIFEQSRFAHLFHSENGA